LLIQRAHMQILSMLRKARSLVVYVCEQVHSPVHLVGVVRIRGC